MARGSAAAAALAAAAAAAAPDGCTKDLLRSRGWEDCRGGSEELLLMARSG